MYTGGTPYRLSDLDTYFFFSLHPQYLSLSDIKPSCPWQERHRSSGDNTTQHGVHPLCLSNSLPIIQIKTLSCILFAFSFTFSFVTWVALLVLFTPRSIHLRLLAYPERNLLSSRGITLAIRIVREIPWIDSIGQFLSGFYKWSFSSLHCVESWLGLP